MAMVKGLKRLYYAECTKDDLSGVAFNTPVRIPKLNKAGVKRKTNSDIFYADDGPVEKATSRGATEIELIIASLPLKDKAFLLGHKIVGAEMIVNKDDVAPVVAIGYEATKSNGKSKMMWHYGCQFEDGDDDNESTGESVKLKPQTIKATSMPLAYNGDFERELDEESPNYTNEADTFFDNPIKTYDNSAPNCTTTPADNATAVAVGSNIVFTFDKAVQASAVTATNVLVMKVDGTAVAGALSLDTTGKIATFNPTADLTAATSYIAIAGTGIKSLTGVALAAPVVVNFTTA